MEIRKLDETYIEHTYHRHTPILMRGKSCTVYDSEGKAYVDLSAGITVNSLGFSDPAWQTAVMSQLLQLQHASNRYYTAPQVLLAEQLCKRTGMQKAVFGNSGTEANECAIKLARKWGIDRHGADCYHIITLENSFHGHTLGALAAAGQPALKADFGPVLPGFHHVPANDLAAMQAAFAQYPVAGVRLELVQSEDGMKALDADYVQALCALCREKDALLIVDEVQTGNGRTGALYAYELFGIAPDVVTTANGLAAGCPSRYAHRRTRSRHAHVRHAQLNLRREPRMRGSRTRGAQPHRRRAFAGCRGKGRIHQNTASGRKGRQRRDRPRASHRRAPEARPPPMWRKHAKSTACCCSRKRTTSA